MVSLMAEEKKSQITFWPGQERRDTEVPGWHISYIVYNHNRVYTKRRFKGVKHKQQGRFLSVSRIHSRKCEQ